MRGEYQRGAFAGGTVAGMALVSSTLWFAMRAAAERGARRALALRLGTTLASVAAGVILATRTLQSH